jgi:regulator of sigma E protease
MTFIWAIVLFGILIFFHELGHFIFSKLSGVGVQKFSLGFGPALIKRTIGETEYRVSILPLGGYVKMIGEEPGEEIEESDRVRAFNYQPVWKRAMIVLAGPVFNLVLAYLIFVVFLALTLPISIPDLDTAIDTTIENVEEHSPAMKAGLRAGDEIVSINGIKISAWVEMEQIVLESPGKELTISVMGESGTRDVKIVPETKKIKNRDGEEIVFGSIGISKRTTIVGGVSSNSPAAQAGLKKGDVIVALDKTPVSHWMEMAEIISNSPGKEITVSVKRGKEILDISIIPEPTNAIDNDGEEIVVGRIGIMSDGGIVSDHITYAPLKGFEAVYKWCVFTVRVIGKLVTGGISLKQVGGPILIVDAASRAASAGLYMYFNLIAIISVNLAILNLLPIPVLDGGHLLFMSIEAMRGRPLSNKVMNVATRVGFTLLMLLIAFVFYNDTIRIIVPWFQKKFGL